MPDQHELRFAEVDIPKGHTLKNGRVIDVKAVIADNEYGYGDDESVAQMAGDVADRRSSDPSAGEHAYETARAQLKSDWQAKRREMRETRFKAKRPMMQLWEDRDAQGRLRGIHVLTAWGRSPWDRNLTPRMDYIALGEMDLVEMELLFGVDRSYIYGHAQ